MKPRLGLAIVVSLACFPLVPTAARAARPPSYEIDWSRGGFSGPYDVLPFRHPAAGEALFVRGSTGGVAAVGGSGVIWRWSTGNTQTVSAATGDLNHDGTADVAVGSYQPRAVTVLDGTDGGVLAKLPFTEPPEGLVTGDADGDGREDLYVVTQSGFGGEPHTVNLFAGRDLELVWSVPLTVPQRFVMAIDSADLDADGRDDLLFGTYENAPKVYAYGSDGQKRWEADLGGTISNIVAADGGRTVLASRTGGLLASLDSRTGATRWSLPSALSFSDLAVSDLDRDGTDDAAWALYGPSGKSPTFHVLAVDGANGVPIWGHTTLTPPKSIVIGDVDGDGDDDVATSTQDVATGTEFANFVWAYDGASGRTLWTHPFAGEQTTFLSSVALADVSGDSVKEVVVAPYFDVLVGIDGVDGSRAWSAPLGSGVNAVAAADLNGDGSAEVVEGSRDFTVTVRRGDTGGVRWTRDLGGQIFAVETIGQDVLAIALNTVYRLRGSDGSIRWSWPLMGLGATIRLIPQASGEPLIAVGARARRTELGPNPAAGHLSVLDAGTGVARWQVPTIGTPLYLEVKDVNGDGSRDLAVGMTNNNTSLAVYDGARIGTAPVALWQGATDGLVTGLAMFGENLVTTRATVNAVVAQSAATGLEVWRRPMGTSVRLLGSGDVDDDGTPDAIVATDVFAESIAAVSGATGQVLFHVPAGVRFVKAATWADVSGDGKRDLLYASDGGTYGDGGIFAVDGKTLNGSEPRLFWTYPGVNAVGLVPVPSDDEQRWLAYGFTVRTDTLTMIRPVPEDPEAERRF